MNTQSESSGIDGRCILHSPGWSPEARRSLERLISAGSGKGLPVVFDFDNTIVSGDIGEAVMAQLARTGRLRPDKIPTTLAPSFRHPDGAEVNRGNCVDISEYYEKFLACTAHGPADLAPLANGYAWAVEIMAGLTAWEVVEATRLAFAASEPGKRRLIEGTPGATAYPAPFFYPEMVELIGELLRHGFDFWVISASNAWSVRWMLLHGLNPLLRERGVPSGVRSDRIVGVSTLLSNREGQLFKDSVLALENPRYADLDEAILTGYRLTSRLHFPVPTYSGKVACIFDLIGRAPYLCAGDSPGDLPMLKFSANRLWIARKEKPDYQQTWLSHATGAFGAGWILQPTQAGDTPGFLPRDDNHVPAPTRAGEPAVQSPAQMI